MSLDYPEVPGVEFRGIPEFPDYCVGDDGSVWSCKRTKNNPKLMPRWRIMTPGIVSGGYHSYLLCRDNRPHTYKGHRIVLTTFVGPRPDGMVCCHLDDDPTNNRLENLRWDTQTANKADSRRNGTLAVGSRIGCSKLTEVDIPVIRQLLSEGRSQQSVADQFGVNQYSISMIHRGLKWKHVKAC